LVWLVAGLPTALMYTISTWALVKMTWPKFIDATSGQFQAPTDPVPWAGVVLILLATMMLVEAARAIFGPRTPPTTLKPAVA
jgi:hypothetical protein